MGPVPYFADRFKIIIKDYSGRIDFSFVWNRTIFIRISILIFRNGTVWILVISDAQFTDRFFRSIGTDSNGIFLCLFIDKIIRSNRS